MSGGYLEGNAGAAGGGRWADTRPAGVQRMLPRGRTRSGCQVSRPTPSLPQDPSRRPARCRAVHAALLEADSWVMHGKGRMGGYRLVTLRPLQCPSPAVAAWGCCCAVWSTMPRCAAARSGPRCNPLPARIQGAASWQRLAAHPVVACCACLLWLACCGPSLKAGSFGPCALPSCNPAVPGRKQAAGLPPLAARFRPVSPPALPRLLLLQGRTYTMQHACLFALRPSPSTGPAAPRPDALEWRGFADMPGGGNRFTARCVGALPLLVRR